MVCAMVNSQGVLRVLRDPLRAGGKSSRTSPEVSRSVRNALVSRIRARSAPAFRPKEARGPRVPRLPLFVLSEHVVSLDETPPSRSTQEHSVDVGQSV